MYKALYRKYRPQGFDSIVGQNTIVKTLQNSVKNKSFGHAYMFFGPRGVGKTTASKIFARAINCLDTIDGNACGKCKNCLHSFEKECVDIIEIDAASNNSVDEIRELKNKISLVPAELTYKVYIIDEVHMLSIGAFNALLKTLEEPPEHVIFILATTDPQKVPDTIISRCQCFSFKRISDDMIVKRLKYVCDSENIEIDDEVLQQIAIMSDGGMRDALSSLDKLASYTREKITTEIFADLNDMITNEKLELLCNDIFSANLDKVLTSINEYNSEGKNLIQIMSQLMHYLRNLLVKYYVEKIDCKYSINKVLLLVNLINEKMFDIRKSSNPKIYIEMLLIKYIKDNSEVIEENSNIIAAGNISREIKNTKNSDAICNNDSIVLKNEDNSLESENDEHNAESVEATVEDDEEYDFDKEFSDDGNLLDREISDEASEDSYFSDSGNEDFPSEKIIKNIDEIMNVRVNNTLAMADKKILNSELEKMKVFSDYTFDQEIGYIACSFMDSHLRAASEDSVILSYEFDSAVKQCLMYLDKFTDVYNKLMCTNKKLAIITDEQWESEKGKYIKCIKDGNHYQIVEEPMEVLEEQKKDDIISNSAIELFGDIVEIN